MRSFAVVALAASLSGCLLFFDDRGGKSCALTDQADIAPAPLRNPDNLLCQSFGGGSCDPACGPCPEQTQTGGGKGGALAPIPSWGFCGSTCDSLDEATCSANINCRVVKDASCAVAGNCLTDFIGCFPTDTAIDNTVDCARATDGDTCSRSNACTALHRSEACPLATDAVCPRDFAMCIPEGGTPGKCFATALCDSAGPACATGTTAGVANGCFTGVCIPNDLCEPPPPGP
jgi:hypothetical protein